MHFCRTARTQGINFKQQVKLFHTVRFLCGRRNGPNILPLNSLKTLQKTGFPSHIMGPLFLFWCFWVTGNNNYVGTWNCCVGFWQMRCKSVAIEKYLYRVGPQEKWFYISKICISILWSLSVVLIPGDVGDMDMRWYTLRELINDREETSFWSLQECIATLRSIKVWR